MDGLQIILLILGIIIFLVSFFVPVINKITILLLHIARIVVLTYWTKNYTEPILGSDLPSDLALITVGFTIVLTLIGFGASAFADTREETGNIIVNPVEGGGYKLCSEITGDSPIGTFIVCIFWSLGIGVATLAIFMKLILPAADSFDEQITYALTTGIILSVIGIIRGIISFIMLVKSDR